ncbi:superoxide dismutase, partial [Cellulosimicrobium terreum]|nr:superoxide dismutase [Cellulosimicrobium terreum]
SPEGGGQPDGELAAAITDAFGSFSAFQAQFAAVAAGIQGSGWAVLGWDSIGQRLAIFQLFDQQANVPVGITPVFMLDMWEHAFYLDYLNVKADYIKAVWNIANWRDVAARFDRAKTQTAGLIVP